MIYIYGFSGFKTFLSQITGAHLNLKIAGRLHEFLLTSEIADFKAIATPWLTKPVQLPCNLVRPGKGVTISALINTISNFQLSYDDLME